MLTKAKARVASAHPRLPSFRSDENRLGARDCYRFPAIRLGALGKLPFLALGLGAPRKGVASLPIAIGTERQEIPVPRDIWFVCSESIDATVPWSEYRRAKREVNARLL